MSTIKAIDAASIRRITSGQVVTDLQGAAKELLENALDAGATSIEIKFTGHGLTTLSVHDNGTGISASSLASIGKAHHTSKLSEYGELENGTVETYGFRGEALAGLCALCSGVRIETACKGEAVGRFVELGRDGGVLKDGKVARTRGTTVALAGLFTPLPVRRQELARHSAREFARALTLLSSYALVPCTSSGVRLSVSNTTDSGKKTMHIVMPPTPTLRTCVSALWGAKALAPLVPLDIVFTLDSGAPEDSQVTVKGLISRFAPGYGRAGTDRQFYYLNGRPWVASKVQKAVNETYRAFNATQAPVVIAEFGMPGGTVDINVSPDKRTLLVHREKAFLQALKGALEEAFAPQRGTFDVNGTQNRTAQAKPIEASARSTQMRGEGSAEPEAETTMDVDVDEDLPEHVHGSPPPEAERRRRMHSDGLEEESGEAGSVPSSDPAPTPALVPTNEPLFLPSPEPEPVEPDEDDCEGIVTPRRSQSDEEEDEEEEIDELASPPKVTPPSKPIPKPAVTVPPVKPKVPAAPAVKAAPASAPAATRKPVQMVLDTRGAVWNLKRGATGASVGDADGSVPKKVKVDTGIAVGVKGLRSTLKEFAAVGSQIATADDAEEDGEDEDGNHEEDEPDDPEEMDDVVEVQSPTRIPPTGLTRAEPIAVDESPPPSPTLAPPAEAEVSLDLADEPSVLLDRPSPPSATPAVEVIRTATADAHGSTVRFDAERLQAAYQFALNKRKAQSNEGDDRNDGGDDGACSAIKDANLSEDQQKAEDALARVLAKTDFSAMEVVGQFNLGFIIARRRVQGEQRKSGCGVDDGDGGEGGAAMDDLFIIDQHAADEKYNFERLQAETVIQGQRLFRPLPLELTAGDEILARENLDVLSQNGFDIEECTTTDGEGASDLRLTALPVSKATVFDVKDLEELLHLLHDRAPGQMVRPSKTRAMFAMRACRKSVMVGMHLSTGQMTAVVRHMGTMDQPWNCPHGRPTMRHLADLTHTSAVHRPARDVNWKAFRGK